MEIKQKMTKEINWNAQKCLIYRRNFLWSEKLVFYLRFGGAPGFGLLCNMSAHFGI